MSVRARFPIIGCVVLSFMAALPAVAGEKDVVALFKLKGPLPEAPDAFGLGELFEGKARLNMFDLLEKLRQACSDDHVRAVVFDIEEAQLGLGQIQELRAQFETLRAAGKDILIFCEVLTNQKLLLGSAASRLILLPTGEVVFNGFYGEGLYFKNMLDKIGLQADILHCGSYKSAGEPLYRTGPSKEAEEQTNRLLDSVFEQVIQQIAESRRLKPERVRQLIDVGWFSAKEALEANLVDGLQYREDFINGLKKSYGQDIKVVGNYGKKAGPELNFDNPFAVFFQLFSEMKKSKEKPEKAAIAVVYVDSMITQGESEPSLFGGSSNSGSTTVRKAIADAAKEDAVKALILRVNSPGGSAIASEIICEATKRFKETGRPVVISMGNVAGSGGYYVATLGDTIFAEPCTITGSIGVVGGKIVTKGLWNWVGVTSAEYRRGKMSDIMNTNREFTEDQRAVIQGMMNRVYEEFKGRVKEGRGERIKGDLEPLAGGRVYTGKEALPLGLVDRLGGFADAIRYTAEKADLGSEYELRIYPRPKTLIDILADLFGGQKEEEEFAGLPALGSTLGGRFTKLPTVVAALQAAEAVDPAKARALQVFMAQLELFGRESVLVIDSNLAALCP
jgi:protease-4